MWRRIVRVLPALLLGAAFGMGGSGCATVDVGDYKSFYETDCAKTLDSQLRFKYPNAVFHTMKCQSLRDTLVRKPREVRKVTDEYLAMAGPGDFSYKEMFDHQALRSIRVLVSQVSVDWDPEEMKGIAQKLGLTPFDDSGFSGNYWKNVAAGRCDAAWTVQYSLVHGVFGNCGEFKNLVLDKLSQEQLGRWAFQYGQKWGAFFSECTNIFNEIFAHVHDEREHAFLEALLGEALKEKHYQEVVTAITSSPSSETESVLLQQLGDAYQGLGKYELARDAYAKAVGLKSSNENERRLRAVNAILAKKDQPTGGGNEKR